MKSAAVVGLSTVGLSTAGLSTGAIAAPDVTSYDDEYDDVIDVVDAGANDEGTESITPILESLRLDNTLLYFPPGRYFMDGQVRFTDFEKFGVVGDDATLVPANYHDFDGPRFRLFRLGTDSRPGGHVRFEGFHVDQTAPDTGIRVLDTYAKQRLEVRDVHIEGEHDSGTFGPGNFNVTERDGTGIVERFRAPDGGAWVDNTPHNGNNWRGPIGIMANQNRGTLTFRRCWTGPFPSHGLYASNGSGKIIIRGGWFWDSNGANLRVGGKNSEVRNPTVEITSTREQDQSQRAIRIENAENLLLRRPVIRNTSPMPTSHAISVMGSCENVRIEEGTIDISGEDINHGIVISSGAGEVLIEGVEITHNTTGGYPVWIRDSERSAQVHLRDVSIAGTAGDGAGFRDGIRCARDNCRFSYCDIEQHGRDGVSRNGLVVDGADATVYRTTVRAERFPYVDQGSDNLVLRGDLESFRGGVEAVRLYPGVENPRLRRSRLVNGIDDLGAINLETYRNTLE